MRLRTMFLIVLLLLGQLPFLALIIVFENTPKLTIDKPMSLGFLILSWTIIAFLLIQYNQKIDE